MKKEISKWLLDISKYITTAILLTSIFSDIKSKLIIYLICIASIAITLGIGLYLSNDKKNKNKKH